MSDRTPTPSGDALGEYLARKGLSRAAFGEIIGLSHASISRMIVGEQTPSLQTAIAIEQATKGAVKVKGWHVADDAAA